MVPVFNYGRRACEIFELESCRDFMGCRLGFGRSGRDRFRGSTSSCQPYDQVRDTNNCDAFRDLVFNIGIRTLEHIATVYKQQAGRRSKWSSLIKSFNEHATIKNLEEDLERCVDMFSVMYRYVYGTCKNSCLIFIRSARVWLACEFPHNLARP